MFRTSLRDNLTNGDGFTLIELLVVIAIITILSLIGITTYQSLLKNGRDAKRQADLRMIQSALEQYHNDQFSYPDDNSVTFGSSLTHTTKIYLNTIPSEPIANRVPYIYESYNKDNASNQYICDNTSNQCNTYCLYASLENLYSPRPISSPCSYPDTGSTDEVYNFVVTPP